MGAGAQLTAMFFTVLIAIIFAWTNTLWRPYIYTTIMVVLALYGFLNGSVTSRTLKFFGTTDWNFAATISAFFLPLFISGLLTLEFLIAWITSSAMTHSFKTSFLRIAGWYILNGVLCLAGAVKGYNEKATPLPSPLAKVNRPIPPQPLYMSVYIVAPIFGFIQFAAIYAEFAYLIDSIFKSHMYAMFGFLLINFALQVVIISLLSIVQTYM